MRLLISVLALFVCLPLSTSPAMAENRPPNVIFILADDLGYGDIGAFGQKKIRTPNLDRLAAQGMILTRHYAGSPVCAPSRCVLLTGKHPGHAYVRDNKDMGQPRISGQIPLPSDTTTLASALRSGGYKTGLFGKWGLGIYSNSGSPFKQGFDRMFGYLDQYAAHNHYPATLWDDEKEMRLKNPDFLPYQKLPADADPNSPDTYSAWQGKEYSADLCADRAVKFIQQNQKRPFFLYYATTIPHLALQVPKDALAEYRGKFPEEPYKGNRGYMPHPSPRAAYAAMVTRMDRHIGQMLDQLKKDHLEENTIVIFTSDNGPLYDLLGGTDEPFFNSAGGLKGRKGSVYEGGIRVPGIVRWPGHIQPGSKSDRLTGFEDWFPTLLALTGAKSPAGLALDGIDFAPTLLGKSQSPREFMYREFAGYGGQMSVWSGDWKAVRRNLVPAKSKAVSPVITELYNLAADPMEAKDVAAQNPDILKRLEAIMQREHVPSKLFPLTAIDGG